MEERIRTAAQRGCECFKPSRDGGGIPGRSFVRIVQPQVAMSGFNV
jgi:hypothetical protein